jgi:hypothetical protein
VDGFAFSYNQPFVDRYGLSFEEAELWMRHISQVWVGLEADYSLEGPSSGVSVLVETFLARPEHQIFWEQAEFIITDPGFLAYVDDVRSRLAEPAE